MNAKNSVLFFLVLLACSKQDIKQVYFRSEAAVLVGAYKYADHSWLVEFERTGIVEHLRRKIEAADTLVVHAVIPLCDNAYQGIAPTTPSLGDGFNLRTNLYWATRHGLKRYFEEQAEWRFLPNHFIETDTVMERVSFYRQFENQAKVVLICDAYRGDQMHACLRDYFAFLSGKKADTLVLEQGVLPCGRDADMIVFNGHNGIYEADPDSVYASRPRHKDAVVIACGSYWNYVPFIRNANCFPLVTTTQSLYPGATVLDKIIEAWAMLEDSKSIAFAGAKGYHEMKNCGLDCADKMFHSGW